MASRSGGNHNQNQHTLTPSASKAQNIPQQETARRFSKSRNGMLVFTSFCCVTCKARRVKCDETKPTCSQCARRRITCGGYRIDVRFKEADKPKQRTRKHEGNNQDRAPTLIPTETIEGPSSDAATLIEPNRTHFDFDFQEFFSDWPFLESSEQRPLPVTPNRSQSPPLDLLDLQRTGSGSPHNPFSMDVFDTGQSGSPNGIHSAHHFAHEDFSRRRNSDPGFEEMVGQFEPSSLPSNLSMGVFSREDPNESLNFREDGHEHIAQLFLTQTSRFLSMDDNMEQNKWRTLIWPMAEENSALYDALAAMTCFHFSKLHPHYRAKGVQHAQRSTQTLSNNMAEGSISLVAALAATLALGFAEMWDPGRSSTGMSHIRGAEILLRQLLSHHSTTTTTCEETTLVQFLTNTWTYMDTIARFTSAGDWAYSPDFPPPDCLHHPPGNMLDPLMGYTYTLFPVMRNVADLINRIRAKMAKRNSPAVISQAIELRRSIEDWAPPVDLELCKNPTRIMTDAVQAAEAYRWSILLLLYQAVPELPNLTSYGEIAQQVLVFLATIPLTSHTTIVQILPLVVAGCEAVDDEDRIFVRERWKSMSKVLITGITDRCLDITEEVWKRRDEYLADGGPAPASNASLSFPQVSLDTDSLSGIDLLGIYSALSGSDRLSPSASSDLSNFGTFLRGNKTYRLSATNFPISAAFKKGVDILTRSGCSEYTVIGRLHFLGVMKDWNLQVMLG